MPYLLGIYILQAGYAVLAVAERTDDPAGSASRKSLETFIRVHESCIATLDTKYQVSSSSAVLRCFLSLNPHVTVATFSKRLEADSNQRNFRKALRGTLNVLKGINTGPVAEYQARRQEILSSHRWNLDGNGLLI